MRGGAVTVGMLSLLLLGGCAGEQLSPGSTPAAQPQELTMAGRWMLSAPNAPVCGINFSSAASLREGKVSPEGGCPEKFYMSRTWTLDGSTLAINDEESNPLAKLTFADGRFQGQSTAGTPVTLAPYQATQPQ